VRAGHVQPYSEANIGGFRMVFGSLRVFCPLYHGRGCTWSGDYTAMAHHVRDNCDFHVIECAHCEDAVARRDLRRHELACTCRPTPCAECGALVAFWSIGEHLQEACPRVFVVCGADAEDAHGHDPEERREADGTHNSARPKKPPAPTEERRQAK
jgi:hypothetical protein